MKSRFFGSLVLVSFISFISLIRAEGYVCPYEELGFGGRNDLLYDYYTQRDNYWVRLNETGWITRSNYCSDKGDTIKHLDAGETKCNDSQFTCYWSSGSCLVNSTRIPDCIELCKTVLENKGLSCLGECPGGYKSRNELYSICENTLPEQLPEQPRQLPRRKCRTRIII